MTSVSDYYGPGTWDTLSELAAFHDLRGDFIMFPLELNYILANFKCETCRKDATQYLLDNPFDEWLQLHRTQEYPMSFYMFTFHNWVNAKLKKLGGKHSNKRQWTWAEYKAQYLEDRAKICKGGCGD